MSKKNRNNPKQQVAKVVPTPKPSITVETKLEIETKKEELTEVEPVDQLSQEAENKLKESETKEDITRYWNYVKDINKKLETLINKTEDEKVKVGKLNENLELSKNEIDAQKGDLKKKLEEYNNKDKELTEREFSLDNGEFTGVVRRLLDTLKDTEKKIFTAQDSPQAII